MSADVAIRKLSASVVFLIALYVAIAAVRFGVSDIFLFQARSYLDAWRTSADPIDQHDWEVATGALESALALMPNNPNYLELGGDMHMLRSSDSDIDEERRAELQEEGLDFYRRAILRRPGWPYGWAKFALLKNVANEVDEETSLAVMRATELGPFEPIISSIVSEIALTSWYSFGPDVQAKLMDEVVKMAKANPQRTMKLAMDNEMMTIVCPRVATIPGWELVCENPEEPTPLAQ